MTTPTSQATAQQTQQLWLEREALLPTQRTWIMGLTQLPTQYQPPLNDEPKAELTKSTQIWFLIRRILDFRSTPENERWNDAQWPTDDAFVDAAEFIRRLPEPLKATPHISLADDGEVNFAWHHGGVIIDLGFYGTGTFSYYARDNAGNERFGDEVPARRKIPTELRNLIAG
jgi:hypothetical protein